MIIMDLWQTVKNYLICSKYLSRLMCFDVGLLPNSALKKFYFALYVSAAVFFLWSLLLDICLQFINLVAAAGKIKL